MFAPLTMCVASISLPTTNITVCSIACQRVLHGFSCVRKMAPVPHVYATLNYRARENLYLSLPAPPPRPRGPHPPASRGLANARSSLAILALGLRRLALCLEISLLNSAPLPPLLVCLVELPVAAALTWSLRTSAACHVLLRPALVALFPSREIPVAARTLPIFRRVDARRGEQAAATHRGSFEGCGVFLERLGRGASHALVSLREVAVPASQTDPCGWLCDRVGLRHNRDLASVFSRRPPAASTATTTHDLVRLLESRPSAGRTPTR